MLLAANVAILAAGTGFVAMEAWESRHDILARTDDGELMQLQLFGTAPRRDSF